jgi:hypothetical protein
MAVDRSVSRAIDALKNATYKSKDRAVKTAIAELDSVLKNLASSIEFLSSRFSLTSSAQSSSSTKTHTQLPKVFNDGKLNALYPAFPLLMCDFCAVVLTAIFHEKVKPAFDAGDLALQSSWENVQKAVVTNVLVRAELS